MGIGSYFKAGKPGQPTKKDARKVSVIPEMTEKDTFSPPSPRQDYAMTPLESGATTPYGGMSSRVSLAPSSKSTFMDDIKHEVMVNYLFQQQCARLWVGDGSGEVEGVLIKKARGQYLACPPNLTQSVFAAACTVMNVPVSRITLIILKWQRQANAPDSQP